MTSAIDASSSPAPTVTVAALRPFRQATSELLQCPPTLRHLTLASLQQRLGSDLLPITASAATTLNLYNIIDMSQFLEAVFEILMDADSTDADGSADATKAAAFCLLAAMFDDAFPRVHLCYRALRMLEAKQTAAASSVEARRADEAGGGFPSDVSGTRPPTVATDSPGVSPVRAEGTADGIVSRLRPEYVRLLRFADPYLKDFTWRPAMVRLLRKWDASAINVGVFSASPETLHVYLPNRTNLGTGGASDSAPAVYRDFVVCTQRPKLTKQWGPLSSVHIKTNIPARSDVMYRILVEGFNYGVNAPICSDVVGCTHRNWDAIGCMEKYGWPAGWDATNHTDYAPGCSISQYYSSDKFLCIKLQAKSMFCVGFTASAWLVTHDYGAGFPISATITHQDDDL